MPSSARPISSIPWMAQKTRAEDRSRMAALQHPSPKAPPKSPPSLSNDKRRNPNAYKVDSVVLPHPLRRRRPRPLLHPFWQQQSRRALSKMEGHFQIRPDGPLTGPLDRLDTSYFGRAGPRAEPLTNDKRTNDELPVPVPITSIYKCGNQNLNMHGTSFHFHGSSHHRKCLGLVRGNHVLA